MAAFRYTAIGPNGELQRGVLDADDQRDAIQRLQRRGVIPMRADPAQGSGWFGELAHAEFTTSGLRRTEVADLIRELATMLGAGQDLDGALRYVQEAAPNARVRRVSTALRDAVRDGSPLSVAMARDPRSFSPMHIGLVRAGEASGNLAPTLARTADLLDRQRSLAATVNSALIYPALLVLVAIGSVTLLLTTVLPQFVPMFEQAGAQLPASTQALIDAGQFVSNDGLFVLLGLLAALLIGRAALRQAAVRLAADRVLLRLPIIGSLRREVLAARFARVLGTLLVNGVSLVAALSVVPELAG